MKQKQGDLKVITVYQENGKNVAFDVQNAAGTQKVDIDGIVNAIQFGHSFVNAIFTPSTKTFRVDSNVPRQSFTRPKLKVLGILYRPKDNNFRGIICKLDKEVKACTYEEFCSTVNNYECDLDDRDVVVNFSINKSFKQGYKYIDISKKDFLKSKEYQVATPALKNLILKGVSNPEIRFPEGARKIADEYIKVGYYDTPNNYKPVDIKFTKVLRAALSNDDDYFYFTFKGKTIYIKLNFKRVDNDDYMVMVVLQAMTKFYEELVVRINEEMHVDGKWDEDKMCQLYAELRHYPYQYPQAILGNHQEYGIHIHNMVSPLDAVGAGGDNHGDCVFRTKYSYHYIIKAYKQFAWRLEELFRAYKGL